MPGRAQIAANLARVRERIEAAGGDADALEIVAVTKGQPAEAAQAAVEGAHFAMWRPEAHRSKPEDRRLPPLGTVTIAVDGNTLIVNGKSAHQARLDHDYGIVFQDSVLFDWRTVDQNVALPLQVMREPKKKVAARGDGPAVLDVRDTRYGVPGSVVDPSTIGVATARANTANIC